MSLILVVGIIIFLIGVLAINKAVVSDNVSVSAFLLLYVIFAFWIGLAVNVKRWHDLDKSGWSELIRVGAFFELGFRKETYGPNRFGSDPLEYS